MLGSTLLAPFASAGILQSNLYFQNQTSVVIGVGTMSFDGVSPADGLYSASAFTNLGFDFSFSPLLVESGLFEGTLDSFTTADLASDLSGVSIYVSGGTFQFVGNPLGSFDASVEFINTAGDYLAFSHLMPHISPMSPLWINSPTA